MMRRQCSTCEHPIEWAQSATGKPMPLDADPDPVRGNVQLVNGMAIVMSGEALERARAKGTPLYLSHFATCPDAAKHRRR